MIQGFSSGLLGNRELIYETDLPSFQRDFASVKTLDHGTGPAITFTRASGATYFDADGVLQTAANDTPRFDHDPATGASLGLLIEESRTNSIRNSQAGGAVVGAPGTSPTNWSIAASGSGLSREIVGTGTEDGMAYIDVRFSGTGASDPVIQIQPEASTEIVASNGQTWTAYWYVRLVGGTTAGISAWNTLWLERDAAGNSLTIAPAALSTPNSSALKTQRTVATRTLTNASTARISNRLNLTCNNVTIDITLRIAAPQLEQGAFPTSYIPTTTAAATRSADSAVVTPISSFYNQSEGTLFAESSSNDSTASRFSTPVGVGTSNNERIFLHRNANSGQGRIGIITGGISQAAADIGAWTLGAVAKIAIAFKTDDVAATINGASVTTDTSVVVPTADKFSIGNAVVASSSFTLNGHIRKIAYWPKRLTNTLLGQLTT
jgi:hypothetical protein